MINEEMKISLCLSTGAASLAPLGMLAFYAWPESLSADGNDAAFLLGFAYIIAVVGAAFLVACILGLIINRWGGEP